MKVMIPVYASALFEFEKPKKWDEMDIKAKRQFILENADSPAGLCHQCSGQVETDLEVNFEWVEKNLDPDDCWE